MKRVAAPFCDIRVVCFLFVAGVLSGASVWLAFVAIINVAPRGREAEVLQTLEMPMLVAPLLSAPVGLGLLWAWGRPTRANSYLLGTLGLAQLVALLVIVIAPALGAYRVLTLEM